MADEDWAAISSELYDLLGPEKTSGELWKAWEHAKDVDTDEYSDARWQVLNQGEMDSFQNDCITNAESAYATLHSTWKEHFYDDRGYITVAKSKAEAWDDDVAQPLRNEPFTMNKSDVAESWYGESATKYATALQTQTAAMTELNAISSQMANAMNSTRQVLQGIMLAIKNSCTPVKDGLYDCKKDSAVENVFHSTFFENISYGKTQFEGLRDWLSDLADGDWKTTMDDLKIQLEDAKVKTQAFEKDIWPKSTTGNMQDMQNGKQTQPGQQPGQQTQQPPADNPYQNVDTDSDGTPQEEYTEEEYVGGTDQSGSQHDDIDPNAEE